MKRFLTIMFLVLLITGCAKPGEQGPMGPTGSQGPAGPSGTEGPEGPAGPGYSEIIIYPTMDNYLSEGDENAGSEDYFLVGNIMFSSYRTLLHFDIKNSEIPNKSTVVSAILNLKRSSSGGYFVDGPYYLSAHLYPLTKSWTENGSTWDKSSSDNNWSSPGGDFLLTKPMGSFFVDLRNDYFYEITINVDPCIIQNWLNGESNYGFIIISDDESNKTVIAFDSKDNTGGISPSLKIIYKQGI